MASRYGMQSDDDYRKYINQLYGGSPPTDDYYRRLGRRKRMSEEREKARKEAEREREKQKEAEEKMGYQELKELLDKKDSSSSSQPKKEKKDNKGGFFDSIGDFVDGIWKDNDNDGKKIDDLFGNIVNRGERTLAKAVNSAGLGVLDNVAEKLPEPLRNIEFGMPGARISLDDILQADRTESTNGIDKALDFIGEGAGYFVPGAGAVRGAKAIGLGAKYGDDASRMTKALQRGKEGAVAGGLYGLAEAGATETFAPEERDALEHAKRILIETGVGAVADTILGALGDAVLKRLRRGELTPEQAGQEIVRQVEVNRFDPNLRTTNPDLVRQRGQSALDDILNAQPRAVRQPNVAFETSVNPRGQFNEQQAREIMQNVDDAENTLRSRQEEYVRQQLKDVDDVLEQARRGDAEWKLIQDAKARRKEVVDALGKNSIYVDPSMNSDWKERVPKALRSAKNEDAKDIYKAAETLGFSSDNTGVEEMLDMLESVYSTTNARKSDLMPTSQVPSRQEYDDLVYATEEAFRGTDEYKAARQTIDSLSETAATSFTPTIEVRTKQVFGDSIYSNSAPERNVRNVVDNVDVSGSPIADPQKRKYTISAKDHWRNFEKNWLDSEAPARIVEEAIRGVPVRNISADSSFYKLLRGTRASTSIANDILQKRFNPLFQEMRKAGLKQKEVEEYALALHLRDIKQAEVVKQQRIAEIDAMLDQGNLNRSEIAKLEAEREVLALEYTPPKEATPQWIEHTIRKWENNEKMNNVHKQVIQHSRDMLRYMQGTGLKNAEQVQKMVDMYPNYVPMQRDLEAIEQAFDFGAGPLRPKDPVKRLKQGSENKVLSPFEVLMRNTYLSVSNGEMNKAMRIIEELSSLDGGSQFFRKIPVDENSPKKLTFYSDGQKVAYEVLDEGVFNMAKYVRESQVDELANFLQKTTQLLRATATQYNPMFILRSILRDPIEAVMVSRNGMNPFTDLPMAWLDLIAGPQLQKLTGGLYKSHKELYNAKGGRYVGHIAMDKTKQQKMVQDLMKDSNKLRKYSLMIANPGRWVSALGESAEIAPRLAEFRAAKRKGKTDDEAIFQARDIIDYSNAGEKARAVNRYVAFFNAAIRGNVRLIQAMKEQPIQTITRGVGYVAVPTAMIHFMKDADWVSEEQRQQLDNLQDWEKSSFWHIPNPLNDRDIIVVPKPHLAGDLFANPVEEVLDLMREGNPIEYKRLAQSMAGNLRPPTGIPFIQPLIESFFNYDLFYGMDLVTDELSSLPPEQQVDAYTSLVAQKVGEIMSNVPVLGETRVASPKHIDNFLRDTTGGVGNIALDSTDKALSDVEKPREFEMDLPSGPAGSGELAEYILGNSFLRNNLRSSGQSDEIYDKYFKLEDVKATERYNLKEQMRQIDPAITNDEITDLLRDNYEFGNADLLKEAKDYRENLSKISQEIENIRKHKTMSAEQKREAILRLREVERLVNERARQSGVLDKIENVVKSSK